MAQRTVFAVVLFLQLLGAGPCFCGAESVNSSGEMDWPAATRQCRPWARWWWLGSAVDKTNLTQLLTEYRKADLGGVEICPIYGAKGFEDRFIEFLSPKWMEMLGHTVTESERLDLGVDLTAGTGWPFGGPWVSLETASAKVILNRYELDDSGALEGRLQCLMAVSDSNEQIELTDKVKEGQLFWAAPPGKWRLYALLQKSSIQKVKRAALGGEGWVLDPYSVKALNEYLAKFDKAFAGYRGDMPRSYFHDSFEYHGADWTSDFFEQFESRRGYDLRRQLPAFFGDAPADTVSRVRCDYRRTISDLHLAYIQRWTQWCHEHGGVSRNQAHGAPGNLLDLYAAADIPETEIFGDVNEKDIPILKLSSSAVHLTGGRLASAESFTWLGEHFQVPLSDVKPAADFLFLAGINHIFFHGIPYSPGDVPWPGWQFYASVNFGPRGNLWFTLPDFNAYVTRCQSILQSGRPANDVLLYFPVYDIWQSSSDDLLIPLRIHNQQKWLRPSSFYSVSAMMWNRGYTFDGISDQLLAKARCEDGKVLLGGNTYAIVLVPQCRFMPVATLGKLVQLARSGATILFQGSLPDDIPGLANLEKRRAEFRELLSTIQLSGDAKSGIRRAVIGKGKLLTGNVVAMLQESSVCRESCVDMGIRFVRRAHSQGHHYFLVNRSEHSVDGWVPLGLPVSSVVIMDPLFATRTGLAALRHSKDGSAQVYLQLQPGQSCILRTFTEKAVDGAEWCYFRYDGPSRDITGTWKVRFVEGGPELPAGFETPELASWTTLGGDEAKRFAGTASYTIKFDLPDVNADDWLLDLGQVCDSARVLVKGRLIGALWSRPFAMPVGKFLHRGGNELAIEVTNLDANRIRDLDRRKVNWKYFYDINFVDHRYKPFDASNWPVRDSGLLGPVRLQPLKKIRPAGESVVR